jgi:hypothetical protein
MFASVAFGQQKVAIYVNSVGKEEIEKEIEKDLKHQLLSTLDGSTIFCVESYLGHHGRIV